MLGVEKVNYVEKKLMVKVCRNQIVGKQALVFEGVHS